MNLKKYTPENISVLEENQIFVYGDNMAHIHGAGAALQALKFGAKYYEGFHIVGQTYGIPTKNKMLNVLSLDVIQHFVDDFLVYIVGGNLDKEFLVTKIGTGLSGYSNEDIAPLFVNALNKKNCILPVEFVHIIIQQLTFDKFKELFPIGSIISDKENDLISTSEILDFDDYFKSIKVKTNFSWKYVDFKSLILY